MNRQFGLGILLLATSILSSCSGGSNAPTDFIPNLPIQCSPTQVADCSNNTGITVYVGLIASLPTSCSSYLKSLMSGQFAQSFTATGSVATTQNGGYLYGIVTEWKNSTGGQVFDLDSGSYVVCGFADANGNGVLDTNEPVGSGQLTVGVTGYKLTSWQAAP